MDADFQPTLLMEKTKVGTLLVSAQILWGKGVSPCLNSWQMHILWHQRLEWTHAERRNQEVHGQGRSWAAGARTAGFGPEPD